MSEAEKAIKEIEDQYTVEDQDKPEEPANTNEEDVEKDEEKLEPKKSSESIKSADTIPFTGGPQEYLSDEDSDGEIIMNPSFPFFKNDHIFSDSVDLFGNRTKPINAGNDVNDVLAMPGISRAGSPRSKRIRLEGSQELVAPVNEGSIRVLRPVIKPRSREPVAPRLPSRPPSRKSTTRHKPATPKATRGRPKNFSNPQRATPTRGVKRPTSANSDRVLRSATRSGTRPATKKPASKKTKSAARRK